MPWTTPTLKEIRGLVRDNIRGKLPGADASVPNSVLRVLSDAQGGLCHLNLQYLDWLALQLLPDTAETEWLDRHGEIWLVNADGTLGRKQATFATGTVTFTGINGVIVPTGTILSGGSTSSNTAVEYETTEQITIGNVATPAAVRALDPGLVGNMNDGDTLAVTTTIPGLDSIATVVELTGGVDTESDDDLRARVLRRIRQPPMGGAAHDYEAWALAVPGCTRAWCAPNEMGIGTVTVRVLFDKFPGDPDPWPTQDDLAAVTAYIDKMRPVAVKDFWVVAPVKQFIDVAIDNLVPDTEAVRAAIEQGIKDMLFAYAAPGQTIFAAWKSFAIMETPGVESFHLSVNTDDVMESPGHMAVLDTISYGF